MPRPTRPPWPPYIPPTMNAMGLLQPEWLYYHYNDYEDDPPNADPQPRPVLASAPVTPPPSPIRIRLHARRE